jgi:hypothetical protein
MQILWLIRRSVYTVALGRGNRTSSILLGEKGWGCRPFLGDKAITVMHSLNPQGLYNALLDEHSNHATIAYSYDSKVSKVLPGLPEMF